MSTTDVVIATGALAVAIGVAGYFYFTADRPPDQRAATSQQSATPPETRSASPQVTAPPPAHPQREQIVQNTPQPPPANVPTQPIRHRRRATQKLTSPGQSKVSRESSTKSAEPMAAAGQTSQEPSATVLPPSSEEQRSQSTAGGSQDKGGAASAALQPPLTSPPVQSLTTPFAMLRATGKILLNGNLSDDSAIFSGESIETPPDTYATVVRENSEILIKPNSRLRITEKGVELERGDVLVTTSNSLPVEANHLTIAPSATSRTKYEVLQTSESPEVKTYEGSVQVNE